MVVEELAAQGRKVIVIGRKPIPPRALPPGVKYFSGNFGDTAFLAAALQGVDEIIDLAYASVPKTSYDDPVQDILLNLPPVVNLFEVANNLSITKLIVVSSGGASTVMRPLFRLRRTTLPIRFHHTGSPSSPLRNTPLLSTEPSPCRWRACARQTRSVKDKCPLLARDSCPRQLVPS